jgi:hypothetical protein
MNEAHEGVEAISAIGPLRFGHAGDDQGRAVLAA